MAPYPPLAVANHFIKKSLDEGKPVSPMKLIKLVYEAHGWYLGLTGEPLINEAVQAWKYGPVIKSLYHKFKQYGNSPIDRMATTLVPMEGRKIRFETVPPPAEATSFLDRIWTVYSKFTAAQLSTISHAPGGPWDQVWSKNEDQKDVQIPNDLILSHYQKMAEKQRAKNDTCAGAGI